MASLQASKQTTAAVVATVVTTRTAARRSGLAANRFRSAARLVMTASEQTSTTLVMAVTTEATMATESGVNLTFATDQGHTNQREKDRDTKSENTIHLRILQTTSLTEAQEQ